LGEEAPDPGRRRRGPARDGLRGGVATSGQDIDRLFRRESGRAVATLIRVLGDFDLAEEAVQDAFVVALERWPRDGVPDNPGAWITRVARNRAIDRLRRRKNLEKKTEVLVGLERMGAEAAELPEFDAQAAYPDDRLRLIFTCCHPALAPEARVALTLRTLGGLTTAEIARAFLVAEAAMAQRLVRAKRKIRDAGIPYEVPPAERLGERLPGVLATLYLVFNEGYLASSADSAIRRELCAEAIRLARLLIAMMPGEPEPAGLLALMLLHDARHAARTDPRGEIVLLADQDRSLWDRDQIARGTELARFALVRGSGPYAVQAGIAAEHCRAATAEETDWARIRALYDALAALDPSPVISLNRAVAVAMESGPEEGLAEIDRIDGLDDYHLLHSARADLLSRAGRPADAVAAYDRALALATSPVERSFLERRRAEIAPAPPG
jgi:RNA polymerase sigma-70 factor (ECF subfamily)